MNIEGYRKLNDQEIYNINSLKKSEKNILEFMQTIPDLDPRWSSIAKTHFQQGFMSLVRAIAKPYD